MKKGKIMWKELKRLWTDFRPRLTYKYKQDKFIIGCMWKLNNTTELITWAAIRPVITDLKKLQNNTWDKELVQKIITYLTANFEVRK